MLMNLDPRKLEPKYFRPYKIRKASFLGTYALQTPTGRILRHLVHRNRLMSAVCKDPAKF